MGILFWTVAVGAAGYIGYRKLRVMESELRSEVAGGEPVDEAGATEEARTSTPSATETEGGSLEERICHLVAREPGLLQTDLYQRLQSEKRRTLQELLREMDREGRLKRVAEKGTYRLFPEEG